MLLVVYPYSTNTPVPQDLRALSDTVDSRLLSLESRVIYNYSTSTGVQVLQSPVTQERTKLPVVR